MELNKKKIDGGLYLIVDPRMGTQKLLKQLEDALDGGVDIVQIGNYWEFTRSKESLIQAVIDLTHQYDKPVLVHEEWEWLIAFPELDGVHFSSRPSGWELIKEKINRPFIAGMTCTNDLLNVHWAIRESFDYLSFCSLYPSPSVDQCEIVDPQMIRMVRDVTDIPLFGAGGILPHYVPEVMELGVDGVAVISTIMNAQNPYDVVRQYKSLLTLMPNQKI